LPNKGWLAKRIAPSKRALVASPDYLRTNGMPRTIGDLERHRGIIYSHRGASDWRFRQSGRWSVVRPRTIMRVNNGIIMRDAAVEGLGIALLATFHFHDLLISGKLCDVDVSAEAEPASIVIGYPTDRRVSAKVLALIAHLRTTFGTGATGLTLPTRQPGYDLGVALKLGLATSTGIGHADVWSDDDVRRTWILPRLEAAHVIVQP
jgi:DNA-binding transcriptional LysR family regulator